MVPSYLMKQALEPTLLTPNPAVPEAPKSSGGCESRVRTNESDNQFAHLCIGTRLTMVIAVDIRRTGSLLAILFTESERREISWTCVLYDVFGK
jgi:hypothetical protein